jgi:iron(III) transport system substrate-binding protein
MKAGFSQRDRRQRPTFLTKNSPAMSVVEQAGLLALVDPATPAQVAPRIGVAARSTVFVHNKTNPVGSALLHPLLDLAGPV